MPIKLLPAFIRAPLKKRRVGWYARKAMAADLAGHVARPHGLDAELIVSLTSYPARFDTLHLTLRCLMTQSVRPDRILLWIAHDDAGKLPQSVKLLEEFGLSIRLCEDIRSYKKLIFALRDHPGAYIATADDDAYYPRGWLQKLVEGLEGNPRLVTCHRAHRMTRDQQGSIAPYSQWQIDVQDEAARRPSTDLVPTGVGGILYPPNSLHPIVSDRPSFESLCPNGDDLWFYWTARMAGTEHRKVGGRMRIVSWPDSQDSALWNSNEFGGNDEMIRALETASASGLLRGT